MTISFLLHSQFAMRQQIVYETEHQCFYPTLADIDSDGDEDVIAKYVTYITVHENQNGHFTAYNIDINDTDLNHWYSRAIIADMDNDNDQDIVIENRWLENVNGDFSTVHFYLDPTIEDFEMRCKDLNNDGSMDLLLFGNQTYPVDPNYVLLNDGAGSFTLFEIPAVPLSQFRLELEDMNADGFVDMVYMANLGSHTIWCAFNDGTGQFLPEAPISDEYPFSAWALADMNEDSWTDIVMIGEEDNNMKVYYNSGTGIMNPATNYYLATSFHYQVTAQSNIVTDYDGDGDNDLMLTVGTNVHWVENGELGFVENGVVISRPANPSDISWLDLNGDNKKDAAFTQHQFITYLQGDDAIQFPNEVEVNNASSGDQLILTDFDHDGSMDISTVNSFGLFNLELNDFGGLEKSHFDATGVSPDLDSEKSFDFNFDGEEDFLFRRQYGQEGVIGAYKRVADGYNIYEPGIIESIFSIIIDFYPVDVDMDNIKDLVVASMEDATMDISWYRADLNGDWQWMESIFTGSNTANMNNPNEGNTMKTGDFNGDGFMDISFVRPGMGYVFEGNGTSQFTAVEIIGNSSTNIDEQFAIADFNMDGRDDILFHSGTVNALNDNLKIIKSNGTNYSVVTLDNANLIADAVAEDFDLDGDIDLVYSKSNWSGNQWPTAMYLKLNNNGSNFGSPVQLVCEVTDQITDIEATDIDGDNMPDLIYATHAGQFWESSVFTSINLLDSPYQIHFHTFIDENGNGVMDTGEVGIANRQIALEQNLGYVYTNEDGEFLYYGLPGEVTASISENASLWNETSPWSQTVLLDDITPEAVVYFALQPNGIQPIVDGVLIVDDVCNGNWSHWISIVNNGNTVADGVVTYTLDPLYTFTVADPAPDIVNGNTLAWSYSDLYYGESRTIEVGAIAPGAESIGQSATQHLVVDVVDLSGVIATISVDHSHIIACAFDPNSIEETMGVTDAGYILADGILEYTVHFQNLGNAPATTVHVEDALSDKFDLTSLQPIASSHPFSLEVSANGQAKFSFENINLPSADADFDASSGFVTFTIKPIPALPVWSVIPNKAEIFFDLNPGIETNTEINTIYDCTDLEQASVSEMSVCSGEEITCNNNAIWLENLIWSFNGIDVGTGSYSYTVNESGTLTMHAANQLCDVTQSFEIAAVEGEAEISQNLNDLFANEGSSYQWFFNGDAIEGANSQMYHVTTTGLYSVEVTNDLGCTASSIPQLITVVNLDEMLLTQLAVFPNPVSDLLCITIPASSFNVALDIMDYQGKIVLNGGRAKSQMNYIDTSSLAAGNYFLRAGDEMISFNVSR